MKKIVYVIYSFKTIKNSPGALWDQSRRVAFCPTGSAPGTPPVPRRSTGRHPLCVCRRRRCLCYCLIYLKIERLLLIIDLFGENYNAQLAKNKQTDIGTHTRTKRNRFSGLGFVGWSTVLWVQNKMHTSFLKFFNYRAMMAAAAARKKKRRKSEVKWKPRKPHSWTTAHKSQ